MSEIRYGSMGWQRDLPDFRDLNLDSPSIQEIIAKSEILQSLVKPPHRRIYERGAHLSKIKVTWDHARPMRVWV